MSKDTHSLVRIIAPKGFSEDPDFLALSAHCDSLLKIEARGTLVRDKWYQRFLPVISPEQDIIECIVDKKDEESFMNLVIDYGGLYQSGSGAVYSVACHEMTHSSAKKSKKTTSEKSAKKALPKPKEKFNLNKELVLISTIIQKGNADDIIKGLVDNGCPSPSTIYATGRGIRDRMGLVRIAISPEKELVYSVVDDTDVEKAFDLIIKSGDLDVPGAGFMYEMKLNRGLINLLTSEIQGQNAASIQQIVRAIDELKGNSNWRYQGVKKMSKKESSPGTRTYLEKLKRLTFVVERGYSDSMVQCALQNGAPGLNIIYSEDLKPSRKNEGFSQEKEIVEMVLSETAVAKTRKLLMDFYTKDTKKDIYSYVQDVPKAFTYLG